MKRILSIAVFLIAISICSCKKPQAFQYRDIKNVKVSNWSFANSAVSLDIVFFNPNNYGVTLKNVNCNIYIDSTLAGKYILDTTMHIPRNTDFILPVNLDVDMKAIFKNALPLLINNEVLIGANGTTRVGKGGFYVTIPFSYEAKHQLNLF